jgi:hypothetical protein
MIAPAGWCSRATGALRVEQLDALGEPASLSGLRERVNTLLPPADLPDLVLEIAAKTGFIDAFTNDQEPSAQLGDLHTSLCAGEVYLTQSHASGCRLARIGGRVAVGFGVAVSDGIRCVCGGPEAGLGGLG